MRIGVVADTHCPEFLPELPEQIFRVLSGVETILHAGDVNGQSTLDSLARIAPVQAVRGDHDHALTSLPLTRAVTLHGKKIVVVHGHRSRWIEEPATFLWTVSLGSFHPHGGLPRVLRRRFPDADVIVYGHTHRAHIQKVDGALLFNPGGVHQWNPVTARQRLREKVGWFEWCWLQIAKRIRSYERPSVGVLEIDEYGVRPIVTEL